MADNNDEEKETEPEKDTETVEQSDSEQVKKQVDPDMLKKGIALGTLALGLYTMDKLLAEEKTVMLANRETIKVRKGFLDEFFE